MARFVLLDVRADDVPGQSPVRPEEYRRRQGFVLRVDRETGQRWYGTPVGATRNARNPHMILGRGGNGWWLDKDDVRFLFSVEGSEEEALAYGRAWEEAANAAIEEAWERVREHLAQVGAIREERVAAVRAVTEAIAARLKGVDNES